MHSNCYLGVQMGKVGIVNLRGMRDLRDNAMIIELICVLCFAV